MSENVLLALKAIGHAALEVLDAACTVLHLADVIGFLLELLVWMVTSPEGLICLLVVIAIVAILLFAL